MAFEMKIANIFRLSDGRTILAGLITDHDTLIGGCRCALTSGTELRQLINCEGEQIVKKADLTNVMRAIATSEVVNLSAEEAQSGNWRLVGPQ